MKHLYIVAGDDMQGRNTRRTGRKKAGKYLIEEYKKIGVSFPEAASDWYQKVPSEFMKPGFCSKIRMIQRTFGHSFKEFRKARRNRSNFGAL